MCNCAELNTVFLDLDSNWVQQAIPYQGKSLFSQYFLEWDSDQVAPELDYSKHNYQCLECDQYWYFECSPEQSTWPLFGIKRSDKDQKLSEEDIKANQEFVTILAHNGFEPTLCRAKGCHNFKLKGKELCHKHITLP